MKVGNPWQKIVRELLSLFRVEGKITELWHSARSLSKTARKSRKQPGRPQRSRRKHFWDSGSQVSFPARQSHWINDNRRHPAKMGVGRVMCTSSLSIPSELFALNSKLKFGFLFQENFSFVLFWSWLIWANLPSETHPAQCPRRLLLCRDLPPLPNTPTGNRSTGYLTWLSQE